MMLKIYKKYDFYKVTTGSPTVRQSPLVHSNVTNLSVPVDDVQKASSFLDIETVRTQCEQQKYTHIKAARFLLVLAWFMPILASNSAADYKNAQSSEFIKSFVRQYDFSQEGRYTHEYHTFLLDQTRKSLETFEGFLKQTGFDCKGRLVIMGYQKEGVPSYYSSLTSVALTDESSLSGQRGRVVPAHNIFGFLTGFLLKDANWFWQKWHPQREPVIEHIGCDSVDLFDDSAYFFQKHAFGNDFEMILDNRKRVEKSIKVGACSAILDELILFWERAYRGDLKSSAQEVLATQDILFSIDYARHLNASIIPVSKLYVGPDITYPIEVLSFQEQAATESAQKFVEHFTKTLVACDGQKTAYIFCSFVDGVGKSTLLGNVINWSKHKDDIKNYERVDNSSSQKGVLYSLKPDVFIMDLPAQLSHWVVKPDGHVFVDFECVHEAKHDRKKLEQYVSDHETTIRDAFTQVLTEYGQSGIKPEGPLGMYLDNLILFNPEQLWIPFTYGDWIGIFDDQDLTRIRILVPLEGVHSKGLKSAQSEQMLFTKGLTIPMRFEVFMDDVASQMKDAGIEKIVFVDFLSMYPRSSRENVRVNFLLQQAKKMYQNGFDIERSLYYPFVNREVELYHSLTQYKNNFMLSLMLEAATRASLYTIFTQKTGNELTRVSMDTMTELLTAENTELFKTSGTFLFEEVSKKIEAEHASLERYAYDKRYELYAQFSAEPLYAYSSFIENLFEYGIVHPYFQGIWAGMSGQLTSGADLKKAQFRSKQVDQLASLFSAGTDFDAGQSVLTTGVSVQCLETISEQCRDQVTLSPVLPTIRAQWYAALSNLLACQQGADGRFYIGQPFTVAPPLAIKQGKQQTLVVVQRQLEKIDEQFSAKDIKSLSMFNNYNCYKPNNVGGFANILHCTDWSGSETFHSLYAFGAEMYQSGPLRKMIQENLTKKIKDGFIDPVMFTSEFLNMLEDSGFLRDQDAEFKKNIKDKKSKMLTVDSDSAHGRAIALWVRAIATLDMIAKDPESFIITRKGNREDFAATLQLLERMTLPRSFGIVLTKPLFGDQYQDVEPVLPWDFFLA